MTARRIAFAAPFAALTLAAGASQAQTQTQTQTQPNQQQQALGAVLGALFGDRLGVSTNLEAQWTRGQSPLAAQRTQFDTRVDTEARSGRLTTANATRIKADYADLVTLEARYAADGRFTTQERSDLADRYGTLTQVLAEGGYAQPSGSTTASAAEGRADFDRRVDAAVSARRVTRTEGTRLKTEYQAVVTAEAGYIRAGGVSASQRADLDARLDALDVRVGDAPATTTPTAQDYRGRLAAIERALPSSGLATAAQTQLRVEHGDLARLEAAYTRINPSADDRAYIERRLADLETRARVHR